MLRSMRLGEADRVLHLYTAAHGRVGAVAKGVRKTMSRFGARLEPLSHVELVLHRGRGELQTVTAAQLVRSHREAREDYYRFSVGMIGAEAMLRLFSEEEANERAFTALTRFLDLLDGTPHAADRPTLDPLGLAFQLKLLWLAGYLPARHGLRRVRGGGGAARRLLAARRRSGLRALRAGDRGTRARPGRDRRDRGAPRAAARGGLADSASPNGRSATSCAWSPPRTSTTAASACGR